MISEEVCSSLVSLTVEGGVSLVVEPKCQRRPIPIIIISATDLQPTNNNYCTVQWVIFVGANFRIKYRILNIRTAQHCDVEPIVKEIFIIFG